MKLEIKQRIAQLNNGEIPNGYKKTEFGVFPCDWVTDQKLKDIGVFGKGRGIPGEKMQSTGAPCVGYGDIYMKFDHSHFEEAKSFVDEETAKDSQPIEKGTLLFTATGETAKEIGKCVCYNGDGVIYVGGDIITFVSKSANPLFLAYQQYQTFSLKKKAGFGQGHSVVHIQKENLEKLTVAYPPSSQEQSHIAEILIKWDEAIDLYNKQIEALKRYKSICLKKMFPAKGKTTPEWRFKGFTDAWEQRKLGEVGKARSGVGFPDVEQGGTTGIPFFKVSDMNTDGNENEMTVANNYVTDAQIASRRWSPIEELPAIFFAKVGAAVMLNRKRLCRFPFLLDNNTMAYSLSKESWDADFAKALFETVDLTSLVQVGALPSYNAGDVEAMEIMLPGLHEQRQIGAYFQQLDNLITLHQQKCELIQKQRKVYQQYLLNGIVRVIE